MELPGFHTGRPETSRFFERLVQLTAWSRPRVIATTALAGTALAAIDWWSGPLYRPTVAYLLLVLTAAWMGRAFDATGLAVALIGFDEFLRHRHAAANDLTTVSAELWAIAMSIAVTMVLVHVTTEFRNAIVTLRHQARRDPLTGLLNVAAFKAAAEAERARAAREGFPVSIAFLDLDHLKEINDRLGHTGGDRVIRALATALESSVRPYDLVGRLGGDEFALFLPHTDEFAAAGVVARFRHAVTSVDLDVTVGVSVGIATYYSQPAHVREMVSAADALMYEAKHRGRNCVVGRVVHREGDELDEGGVVIDVVSDLDEQLTLPGAELRPWSTPSASVDG